MSNNSPIIEDPGVHFAHPFTPLSEPQEDGESTSRGFTFEAQGCFWWELDSLSPKKLKSGNYRVRQRGNHWQEFWTITHKVHFDCDSDTGAITWHSAEEPVARFVGTNWRKVIRPGYVELVSYEP
jgi:hypothetical protein